MLRLLLAVPTRAPFTIGFVLLANMLASDLLESRFGLYSIYRGTECSNIYDCRTFTTYFVSVFVLQVIHWLHLSWHPNPAWKFAPSIFLGEKRRFHEPISFILSGSSLICLSALSLMIIPPHWPSALGDGELNLLAVAFLISSTTILLLFAITPRQAVGRVAAAALAALLSGLIALGTTNSLLLLPVVGAAIIHVAKFRLNRLHRYIACFCVGLWLVLAHSARTPDATISQVSGRTQAYNRPDLVDTMKAWSDNLHNRPFPSLVIVSASGGAYRASIWTALVLDRLSELDRSGAAHGLMQDIRLLVGASGGQVATAYLHALQSEETRGLPRRSIANVMLADLNSAVGSTGGIDSLQPVARSLLFRDLPAFFMPFEIGAYRGVALERQWKTLDAPLSESMIGERQGWRTPILFSPTIAEYSAPGYISNVRTPDRRETRRTWSVVVDVLGSFLGRPSQLRDMTLARAVRVNATFPIISPNFEVWQDAFRYNLIDAAYFDNTGLFAAREYITQRHVLSFLKNKIKQIVIVRISAFPSLPARGSLRRIAGSCLFVPHYGLPISQRSVLDFVLIPVQTYLNSQNIKARQFENDQIEMISAAYRSIGIKVSVVEFTNRGTIPMSWHQSSADLRCHHDALQAEEPRFNHLVEVLRGQPK